MTVNQNKMSSSECQPFPCDSCPESLFPKVKCAEMRLNVKKFYELRNLFKRITQQIKGHVTQCAAKNRIKHTKDCLADNIHDKPVWMHIFSHIKKASSLSVGGSMTVEAAVVLPLFMVFFINLSCSVEMIRLHSNIDVALWNIGNDLTVYGALTTENMRELEKTGHPSDQTNKETYDYGATDNIEDIWAEDYEKTEVAKKEENTGNTIVQEIADLVVSYTYIKNKIVEYLDDDYLNSSPLVNGTDSLQFYDSDIFTSNDTVVIVATYQVEPLINLDDFIRMRMSNSYYAHLWNGYNVGGVAEDDNQSKTVYVTENSQVYHTSVSCTYLMLSVRITSYDNLSEERNNEGGRYSQCLLCAGSGAPAFVYLCDEGSKYHYSRKCSALKRSYKAVSLASVVNTHRPCSRCGSE